MFFLIALWKYIRFVMIYRQVYYSSVNDNEYQLEKMYTLFFYQYLNNEVPKNTFVVTTGAGVGHILGRVLEQNYSHRNIYNSQWVTYRDPHWEINLRNINAPSEELKKTLRENLFDFSFRHTHEVFPAHDFAYEFFNDDVKSIRDGVRISQKCFDNGIDKELYRKFGFLMNSQTGGVFYFTHMQHFQYDVLPVETLRSI